MQHLHVLKLNELIFNRFRGVYAFSAYYFEGEVKVVIIKTVPKIQVTCQVFYEANDGRNFVQESKGKIRENVNTIRK